jgi:ATP-dependent DNA helicase RecG
MGGGIAVTIFRNIYSERFLMNYGLNERQKEALLNWKGTGEIVTSEYKNKFTITDRTALRDLSELVKKGLLVKVGEKKASKYLYRNKMSDKGL